MNHENPMEPPNGITVIPQTGQWVVTGDSHLGKWAMEHGNIITDPCLFKWLRTQLAVDVLRKVQTSKEPFTVWDCGANVGDHTRWYLDQGFQVVAIEPNPLVFACLTHNCPEAICLNAAASDTAGEPLRFLRSENVGASRVHPDGDILVYPVVLDDENLPSPDLVKIDAEGWEPWVIRGMSETLRKSRPLVFIEFNRGALESNGSSVESLRSLIEGLGYSVAALYPPEAKWEDPQFDVLFRPL